MEDRPHPLVVAAEEGGCAVSRAAAVITLTLACTALAACARTPQPDGPTPASTASVSTPRASAATLPAGAGPVAAPMQSVAVDASLPKVLVHKSPSCGCCESWVAHMRKAGFTVAVDNTDDLEPIRKRLGVPLGKGSCHTAEIGGLIVEGHVPADDIKRLLAARDGARGLVAPGMPAGSPGMEMPDGRTPRYTVEKINADGSTTPFATHGE